MNITLYAICKNEEKNVDKFIENSKKFFHTVVVDTGSTDDTVKLLKDAGIKVYEHPQSIEEFDFSVARNQALSYVETDWAFALDFNEDVDELFSEGLDAISDEFTGFNHKRYDDNETDESVQSFEIYIRFHRTKNYKWVNAVHEMPVFASTETHPIEVSVNTTIKITKKINESIDKELFYLNILERELKINPNNSHYLWFVFLHYFNVRNTEKELEYGQEYLRISNAYFDIFRITVFIRCSQILFNNGKVEKSVNYAFHALSEAMNLGKPYLSEAFLYLFKLSNELNNPNITIFASAFNQKTLSSPERQNAIDTIKNELNLLKSL